MKKIAVFGISIFFIIGCYKLLELKNQTTDIIDNIKTKSLNFEIFERKKVKEEKFIERMNIPLNKTKNIKNKFNDNSSKKEDLDLVLKAVIITESEKYALVEDVKDKKVLKVLEGQVFRGYSIHEINKTNIVISSSSNKSKRKKIGIFKKN